MMDSKKTVRIALTTVFLVAALLALVWLFQNIAFERIPLVIDWKVIWTGIEGADLSYDTGIRNPPWSLLPILPLGLLSEGASWGWLAVVTIAVLILSVPQVADRRLYWTSVVLLVASFPSLRQIADGNLEVLVIAGVLLLLYGYRSESPWILAVGALLAMAKGQETWLLLIVWAIYVVKAWPTRRWAVSGLLIVIVVVPTLMWRGDEWLTAMLGIEHRGTLLDTSLVTVTERLGIPSLIFAGLWLGVIGTTLWIGMKTRQPFSRLTAGMLMAASLLLAPYSAGNNYLTVLAIGVIPFLQRKITPGLLLLALSYVPFFAINNTDILQEWGAYYWTATLAVTWAVLGWTAYFGDRTVTVSSLDYAAK